MKLRPPNLGVAWIPVILIVWDALDLYGHARSGVVFEIQSLIPILATILLLVAGWFFLVRLIPSGMWPAWFLPVLLAAGVFRATVVGTIPDSVGILVNVAMFYVYRPRPPRQRKRRFVWGRAAQQRAAVDRAWGS